MQTDQILHRYILLLLCVGFARCQKLWDARLEGEEESLIKHAHGHVLHGEANEAKSERFLVEAQVIPGLRHLVERDPHVLVNLVGLQGSWVLQHVVH